MLRHPIVRHGTLWTDVSASGGFTGKPLANAAPGTRLAQSPSTIAFIIPAVSTPTIASATNRNSATTRC
jgi:hypothetical protein